VYAARTPLSPHTHTVLMFIENTAGGEP